VSEGDEVADMTDDPTDPASPQLVHCGEHGERPAAFVCNHLLTGFDLGFCWAVNPEYPSNPCPDAWCADCDGVLDAHDGEWNEVTDALIRIRLVCDFCYEVVRKRNMPSELEDDWLAERHGREN
jgi:hypothetical protein